MGIAPGQHGLFGFKGEVALKAKRAEQR